MSNPFLPTDPWEIAGRDSDEMARALGVQRQFFWLFQRLPENGAIVDIRRRMAPLVIVPLWAWGEIAVDVALGVIEYRDAYDPAVHGRLVFWQPIAPLPSTADTLRTVKLRFPAVWLRRELEIDE